MIEEGASPEIFQFDPFIAAMNTLEVLGCLRKRRESVHRPDDTSVMLRVRPRAEKERHRGGGREGKPQGCLDGAPSFVIDGGFIRGFDDII